MSKQCKTDVQLKRLHQFYLEHPNIWLKSQINELSQTISLTPQQIYKWLWDRRKEIREASQKYKVKKESIRVENEYSTINIGKHAIQVPRIRQSPSLFQVHPKASKWAQEILRNYGWQLIREKELLNKSRNGQMLSAFVLTREKYETIDR